MTHTFSFTDLIKHPLLPEIQAIATFEGNATWSEGAESFAIESVMCALSCGGAKQFTPIEIPKGFDTEATHYLQAHTHGDFGRFLSKCRTEAHKAATEAGFFDPVRPDIRKPIMRAEMSDAHNT